MAALPRGGFGLGDEGADFGAGRAAVLEAVCAVSQVEGGVRVQAALLADPETDD